MDIETRGDKRLLEIYEAMPGKLEDTQKGMATDPDFCEIICIGIKEQGKEPRNYTLEEYAEWIPNHIEDTLITYNGKQFDLPVIIRCGIKAGLKLPYRELKFLCEKYRATKHIDLMQELNVGWRKYKSLNTLIQIYLGISKTPVDFKTASDEEIKVHCLEDLANTAKVFNKFKVLF
jgi:predicted PolB exonuclease-like 3'-5' exonuclease